MLQTLNKKRKDDDNEIIMVYMYMCLLFTYKIYRLTQNHSQYQLNPNIPHTQTQSAC